jgi:hypothetical protein
MANFQRIYHDRAEFTKKKVQDLLKAANETILALQACVQSSNGAIYQEDVEPFVGCLKEAFEAINQVGAASMAYQAQLQSRVQRQQLTFQMHSFVAQAIPYTTGQRRIAPAPPKEDL